MSAATTTTVVTVSWHSTARLLHLVPNLAEKASDPVRFLVVDNDDGEDEELAAFSGTRTDTRIVPARGRGLQGSIAHARGLRAGVDAAETDDVLVVDPDVHVFRDGWDDVCRNALADRRAVAVGAPYPFWKLGKYHDFPSPIFCYAKASALRELGNEWTPFYDGWIGSAYSFVARKIVRLGPVGTKARLQRSPGLAALTGALERAFPVSAPDTGYRIARAARESGARAVCFDAATDVPSGMRPASQAAFAELVREYELFTYEGVAVLTHQYSSANYHWRTRRGTDVEHWLDCIAAIETSSAELTPA